MTTKFTMQQVEIANRLWWFDGNGKVTVDNGSFDHPVANAFSLPHIIACPGATEVCKKSCYVNGLHLHNPAVYACFEANLVSLEEVLDSGVSKLLTQTAVGFADWIITNASAGFRWHNSGDVMSPLHADFIAAVCGLSPDVNHWIYTRTFDCIDWLADVRNLTLNISVDADNYRIGKYWGEKYDLRLCYLTHDGTVPTDLPSGSVIFPDYPVRGRDLPDPKQSEWWQSLTLDQKKMVCPPDFFGQSETNRCGPCRKCLWTPTG